MVNNPSTISRNVDNRWVVFSKRVTYSMAVVLETLIDANHSWLNSVTGWFNNNYSKGF